MIQINQIKLNIPITDEMASLKKECCKLLHCKEDNITKIEIHKKSLDARKKPNLFYIYSILIKLSIDEKDVIHKVKNNNVILYQPIDYHEFNWENTGISHSKCQKRPVIIGSGPAGLIAGYFLSKAGLCPILIERGKDVDSRTKDLEDFFQTGNMNTDSNVCFGEGGAGTFSDGKLQTQVKDKTGRIRKILEVYVEHGADPAILYENKPHIGTDVLAKVVKNIRNHILDMGATVLFETQMTDLHIQEGKITGIEVIHLNTKERSIITTNSCVLAIGHSARDTFLMLHKKGLQMENKAFAIGLRIQHSQDMINKSQYGEGYEAKGLPAADYKLTYQATSGRGVYSFCMCPGGYVINASNEEDGVVVNGMSYHDRASGNANSAIVITVDEKDYGTELFDGMRFQKELEHKAWALGQGKLVLETYGDFKKLKHTDFSQSNLTPMVKGIYSYGPVSELMPINFHNDFVEAIDHFGHIIMHYDSDEAILCGIESRTSSPVRILRFETLESNIGGIYPCGEGAGYAGGITSAAVDGLKVAEKIALLYN